MIDTSISSYHLLTPPKSIEDTLQDLYNPELGQLIAFKTTLCDLGAYDGYDIQYYLMYYNNNRYYFVKDNKIILYASNLNKFIKKSEMWLHFFKKHSGKKYIE